MLRSDTIVFPRIICPECKLPLTLTQSGDVQCGNNHSYYRYGEVLDLLPPKLHETTKADGHYHDSMKDEWVDLNQLNTLRNRHYHSQIYEQLCMHSVEPQNILELGGGNGFDLHCFLSAGYPFKTYTFSEVSVELVQYVAKSYKNDSSLVFCTADATHLPFESSQFDSVVIYAALHHFPEVESAVFEMIRVLKPGGLLVCGIEPNRRLTSVVKFLIRYARFIMTSKLHSPADEEAEGFYISDFDLLAKKTGMEMVMIKPVWFVQGVVHYGLEFIFRTFKLGKRIAMPPFLERLMLNIDEILSLFAFLSKWSWHYTVIFKKPKNAI